MTKGYMRQIRIKLCQDCGEDITGKPGYRCSRCFQVYNVERMRDYEERKRANKQQNDERNYKREMAKVYKREAWAAIKRTKEVMRHAWTPSVDGEYDEWERRMLECPDTAQIISAWDDVMG